MCCASERGRKMRFIDKLKGWWNKLIFENELFNKRNEIAMKVQREVRQEKLISYEYMSERELLIEIAKNTLR